jgi:hypothetical protein
MSVTLTFNHKLALVQPRFAICLVLPATSWPVCLLVADVCCATSSRSLPTTLTFFIACWVVSFTSLVARESRSATCWAYCPTCSGSGRALRSYCQRSRKKRCVLFSRVRRTTKPVTTSTPMKSPVTIRFILQAPFFSLCTRVRHVLVDHAAVPLSLGTYRSS